MKIDIKKILSEYTPIVEKEIKKIIQKNKKPFEAYGLIWDLLDRGGKRFRPAMCIISCEAVGGKAKYALPAAAGIEMLHNATLLHDDIEDNSDERRGKGCIHKIYGVPLAINAGDVLYFSAYLPLVKLKSEKAREILAKSFVEIGEGQAYDIGWVEKEKWDISEKGYTDMVAKKTGALIGASSSAGAYIGGATEKTARILYNYGKAIGAAFQIQDDVLNLIGDVKKYGKEIGGDISEGKRTLIIINTLQNASKKDRNNLIKILSSHTKNKKKIIEAIDIIKRYDGIDYALDYANKLVKKAKQDLKRAKLKKNKSTEILFAFADFFINREF